MAPSQRLTPDPYETIAELYDLEYGQRLDDLDLLLNLARRTGGPLLDVGAGTGRLMLPLAAAGYTVFGLEPSAAMLQVASRKMVDAPGKLFLIPGVMQNFTLPERFALAFLADHTFGHALSQQDQLQTLRRLHRHLQPEGLLLLVLQNPYSWVTNPPHNELTLVWERDGAAPGERITKSVATELDLVEQLLVAHLWYDIADKQSGLRRHTAELRLRWCYQAELALLLERTGFVPMDWYGTLDLEPYSDESPLLIAVAKNPRRACPSSGRRCYNR